MSQTEEAIIARRVHGPNGTPALLCVPKAPGRYACAMVLHERYGFVPHTENLTRKLAAAGFVVLAPVFFEVPDQEALLRGDVRGKVDIDEDQVVQACEDVVRCLGDVPGADPDHLGIVGVCQSGRYPLAWAAKHHLDAAIIFYGAIVPAEWDAKETQPSLEALLDRMTTTRSDQVIGIFGEADHLIPIDAVLRFRNALEQRNISYQISIYPNMPHGWLNETMPGRYRPVEAQLAFDEAVAFLRMKTDPRASSKEIEWAFRSVKSPDYDFTKNTRLA